MALESISITQSLSPHTHGSSISPDGLSDDPESTEVPSRDQATINILPDDALLEIFHFYRKEPHPLGPRWGWGWWWKRLADVCQRWRHIIFASPHGLDLRIECTERTPTRTSLDIWPPFLIIIACFSGELDEEGQDNIIAALEHHDRVIRIAIRDQKCLALEKLAVATQKPFPVVEILDLSSTDDIAPVLHEEFLGGSVPRLRTFISQNIAFPAFLQLALSATHLSYLALRDIPITGYISPEAMATCLATLPSLEELSIGFRSPRSRPDRIGLPSPTRAVLPALIRFSFKGVSEYLEDFVARINTPKLLDLDIDLFMDLMFHIPRLHNFITRAETFGPLKSASITFSATCIQISLVYLGLQISCREPDWQASSMAQVCNQLSPLTSQVTSLGIREDTPGQARRGNGIDPTQWFELFDSFPAVQDLTIHDELTPLVARALQELTGETATEVLPTLRRLHFKGPSLPRSIREDVQQFIAARQDSNHPVDVHWESTKVRRARFSADPVGEVRFFRSAASTTSSLAASPGPSTPPPLPNVAFSPSHPSYPSPAPPIPQAHALPYIPPPPLISNLYIHPAVVPPSLFYDMRYPPSQSNPVLFPAILAAPYMGLRIDDLP